MQQINLYLPEFQPNREPLRSVHMLWGVGLMVLVLLCVTFFTAQRNQQRESALAKQRAQLEQLKTQVVRLEQQRPTVNLADLDAQSVKLASDLGRREKVHNVIVNKNLGNNTGFSAHVSALGRQSLPSISLEAFSLVTGGSYIELAGNTRAVDQVPLYVQRLRTEEIFSQTGFGVLSAEPHQTLTNVFQFSLAKPAGDSFNGDRKTAVQLLIEDNERGPTAPARGIQ